MHTTPARLDVGVTIHMGIWHSQKSSALACAQVQRWQSARLVRRHGQFGDWLVSLDLGCSQAGLGWAGQQDHAIITYMPAGAAVHRRTQASSGTRASLHSNNSICVMPLMVLAVHLNGLDGRNALAAASRAACRWVCGECVQADLPKLH